MLLGKSREQLLISSVRMKGLGKAGMILSSGCIYLVVKVKFNDMKSNIA